MRIWSGPASGVTRANQSGSLGPENCMRRIMILTRTGIRGAGVNSIGRDHNLCFSFRASGSNALPVMAIRHRERHRTDRIGWLRAAVLGANDGIVSTASLLLGVAAANATHGSVLLSGIAGLVAGAMSMAAGEYVSVRSQADSETAALDLERAELKADNEGERRELTAIYVGRGLDPALATRVAEQLMAHDALGAHARDELGISGTLSARPVQAALTSAASFAVGAAMPLLIAAMCPMTALIPVVSGTSLIFLATLGGFAARVGGARVQTGALRVAFWGALAMALTAGAGALVGMAI